MAKKSRKSGSSAAPSEREAATGADALLSSGQIVARLNSEFPDLTLSKIRFLEERGLLAPQRLSDGYRKFSARDMERLRYILTLQRDFYLPLKVIRQSLERFDAGEAPLSLPGLTDRNNTASTAYQAPSREFPKKLAERLTQLIDPVLIDWVDFQNLTPESFNSAVEAAAQRAHRAITSRGTYDEIVGPFFSVAAMSRRWDLTEDEIRADASNGRLLGLPTLEGDLVFPTFQFNIAGSVIPGLMETVELISPALNQDPWAVALWLLGRTAALDSQSAIAYLLQGQDKKVLEVAKIAARTLEQ